MNNPISVQEFVESEWATKIKSLILGFHLHEPVDDVFNSLIIHLLQTNYISRYDESKGAFSTWIYHFVNNFCKKQWNHEHCHAVSALHSAVSLSQNIDEDTPLEELLNFPAYQDNTSSSLFLQELFKRLDEPANSSSQFQGKIYDRDIKTVVSLLLDGYSINEIAQCFNTSVQFVYHLLKKIRLIISEMED